MDAATSRLAELFREAKAAHSEAFADVGGEDDAWPRWYAEHVADGVGAVAGRAVPVDDLTTWITEADAALDPAGDRDWPEAYAEHVLDRLER